MRGPLLLLHIAMGALQYAGRFLTKAFRISIVNQYHVAIWGGKPLYMSLAFFWPSGTALALKGASWHLVFA